MNDERPLDGEDVGFVAVKPLVDGEGDHQQPLVQGVLRRGSHHAIGNHGGLPVPLDVHNADPAAGQAGIHPQDAERHRREHLTNRRGLTQSPGRPGRRR